MYQQHDNRASGEQQYQLPASSGSSPFDQTLFSSAYGIDPRVQRSPKNLSTPARTTNTYQYSSTQNPSTDAHGMLPLSASGSPHLGAEGISQGSNKPGFKPMDRSLPSRNVTAENIADAFVSFILYCNPNFPLDVDVSTLKTNFQNPPKSDNKDFQTFRLFELIKQFDAKEIKTWAQLALDLGVEAPDTAKGQSVQKVQQYSVRLKRWMRATHIDAFFEYLLGKQHPYFLDIPHPSDPYPPGGRDGVSAEEDLAIRALDPSFRPKRGRRRNSETEQEDKVEYGSATKQLRLMEGAPRSAIPLSAVPLSAHPDGFHDPWDAAAMITPGGVAPWGSRSSGLPQSATRASNPNPLRWQLDGQSQTPASPFSLSALSGPMSAQLDSDYDNEPRSAITPSTRKRRKHGPAVSSAWPSANAPGSKPRGRPPANRNIQDGPFGTFPADPTNERNPNRVLDPISGSSEPLLSQEPAALPDETPMFRSQTDATGRPGRLSLQVPPRAGAPVRLATPPQVLVNGELDKRRAASTTSNPSLAGASAPTATDRPAPNGGRLRTIGDFQFHIPDRPMPGFAFEVLRRVLASDLLRAELIGRPRRHRLSGEEARRLADAVLDRLGVPRVDSDSHRDDIARLTAASWLGVGDQLNVPLGPAVGRGKRVRVTRFRTGPDGFEEIAGDDEGSGREEGEGGGRVKGREGEGEDEEGGLREVFDVAWSVGLGGCVGRFEMKDLTLGDGVAGAPAPSEDLHDFILRKGVEAMSNVDREGWLERGMHDVARTVGARGLAGEENIDWKARCKAMEFSALIAKGEVDRFKDRVLEKILDAVL